jgi:hypothetical protein
MDLQHTNDLNRPAFMVTLGLLPPYSPEDVEAAYRSRVWTAHPDRGGNVADFLKLQQAYEQALEYVRFRADRRLWIGAHVEKHVRQQEAADAVARLGGQVEIEEIDWMRHSVGNDFAQLASRLRTIRLQDSRADDAFLTFLAGPPPRVPSLLELSLAGTRITDKGLQALSAFTLLRKLNVARTAVSARGIGALLEQLPELQEVDMARTRVGLLSRWRFNRMLRLRRAEKARQASAAALLRPLANSPVAS